MGMCSKCSGINAILFLIFGILFLIRDLGVWDFWNISAWTVLFLLIGLGFWGKGHCDTCQAMVKKK